MADIVAFLGRRVMVVKVDLVIEVEALHCENRGVEVVNQHQQGSSKQSRIPKYVGYWGGDVSGRATADSLCYVANNGIVLEGQLLVITTQFHAEVKRRCSGSNDGD